MALQLSRTLCAYAFHHEVDILKAKIFGQGYIWYRDTLHAVGVTAFGAMEMNVQITQGTLAIIAAYGILDRAGAVVDTMDQMVFMKKVDRAG